MCLVQRAVIQDLFMDGAGGNEDEPADASPACGFDQSESADNVSLGEVDDVSFGSTKSLTRSSQGGMDYRVASRNQLLTCCGVIQITKQPIDGMGFQAGQITG